MDFRSDNTGSAAPEIIESLLECNHGTATPYGGDEYSTLLNERFSELFEKKVTVLCAVTGTAANAIGLSTITPPYGSIICHEHSHIATDECGAPEFMTGGAKLLTIDGVDAKISAHGIKSALEKAGMGFVHCSQPSAVSLTQATEMGAVYSCDELLEINELTTQHKLNLHMDGARLANAIVSLGMAPADVTWRAGVDILTFGATKNGALGAEAIVLFREDLAEELAFRHKRAGQLISKSRFISAQLLAYIKDDLWLDLASRANHYAQQLASEFNSLKGAQVETVCASNEVFVTLPKLVIEGLRDCGAQFYGWPEPWDASNTIRLVTRWDTQEQEIKNIIDSSARLLEKV
tara:strand:+ start:81399 stop:82445 length:1047 start_codon:yes stop_codon:yes gene_type:complete